MSGSKENKTRQWTAEQEALFASKGGGVFLFPRVAVSADAGSGKTSVLVERIRNIPATERVLCVSFTEKSRADLEERLSEHLNVEVYTIHGFCARVINEFGYRLGLPPVYRMLDGDEADDAFYRVFEKAYRRRPLSNTHYDSKTFFDLCVKLRGRHPRPSVCDLSNSSDQEINGFIDEIFEDFARHKRTTGLLEFHDLEEGALELVSDHEVATSLQSRYAHVFVDEFQDTSALQCALVTALTGSRKPLFVVGDEKQSIYRFRGADVEVFRKFVARLPEHKRLSTNFRSHPEVIDLVNAVCSEAIAEYQPMVAGRKNDPESPGVSRVIRLGFDPKDESDFDDGDAIVAALDHLTSKGVAVSDIALLLRRIRGNEALLTKIKDAGFTITASTSSAGAKAPELMALVNLWIWICEPWQKLRGAQVLIDFEVTPADQVRPRLSDQVELLNDLAGRVRADTTLVSCDVLLQSLDRQFGLAQKFGAVFDQFSVFILKHQMQGLSPEAVARRLDHVLLETDAITGFSSVPAPAALAGALQVLTVHGSKGLEFPYVILADLKPGSVQPDPSRFEKTESGAEALLLASRTDEGELDKENPRYAHALELEKQGSLAESARLLYVALTRAKEGLVLVGPQTTKEGRLEAVKKKKKHQEWLFWVDEGLDALPAARVQRIALAEKARPRPRDATQTVFEAGGDAFRFPELSAAKQARTGVTAMLDANSSVPSPDAADTDRPVRAPDEIDATSQIAVKKPTRDWREIGIEVHRCFEFEDWPALDVCAEKYGLRLRAFKDWLAGAPEAKLVFPSDDRGVFRELAFEWLQGDGEILAGRMDRLIEVGVGDQTEYWLVDFKTLGGQRDLGDLIEKYKPQLEVYASAARELVGDHYRIRCFLLDVLASSGQCWVEVV